MDAKRTVAAAYDRQGTVFRDWLEESLQSRSVFFNEKIISKLSIQIDKTPLMSSP